ncbi:unnamed protein product [Caenorhabditis sp. 36 PRJEB53466]|nr:unnamed protein product [Caenorhabditis sp. 36 PRJEB53466]
MKSSTSMHFSSSSNGYGHSPRDLLTGAAVTTTGATTSPPMPVNLDLQRIDSSERSTVVMLKLTDEMFAALEAGQRNGKKLRIHVDEREGRVEIGDGTASSKTNNTFYFQKQSLPDQTDTLVQTGGVVRNVGTYKTRYQIQATDRSFEETKKRAEMRAEVEKSRGTKEMKKGVPSSSSRYLNSSSSSTPRNMGSSVTGSSSSRVSPPFISSKASTSHVPNPRGTPNGSDNRKVDILKPELMRQSIRKRIIHLVVTQKYKTWEEVFKKFQADGVPKEKADAETIQSLVEEVSEPRSGTSTLSLRTSLLSEVDARWKFFNQDEKAHVRRLQASQSGSRAAPAESTNFAPTRKKGMERMTASKSSSDRDKEKKEKVETPSPPKEEKRVESDDDYYAAPEPAVKRRAHNLAPPPVAAPQTTSSQTEGPPTKRPKRNESTSPLVDPPQQASEPKINPAKMAAMVSAQPVPKFEQPREHHQITSSVANGGGSTASSRISSPASSLSSPSQPSCNWEKQFGDIKTHSEAEQYFNMFHKEYPQYMECHRKLTEVSAEFRNLEVRLAKASAQRKASPSPANIQEVKNIERQIQKRYAFFEKDPVFLRARQRHTDLRSKLNVLKTRIGNWETHRRQTSNA